MKLLPRTKFIGDVWLSSEEAKSFVVLPPSSVEDLSNNTMLTLWIEDVQECDIPAKGFEGILFLVKDLALALKLAGRESFRDWVFYPDMASTLDQMNRQRSKLFISRNLSSGHLLQEDDFLIKSEGDGVSAHLLFEFVDHKLLYDVKAGSEFHFGLSEREL